MLLRKDSHIAQLEQQKIELEKKAKLLELAEELAHMGHWSVDVGSDEVYWSDEIYKIHGRSKKQGPPTLDEAIRYYHPDDRQAVTDHVAKAMKAKKDFSFELRIIREDGETRYVSSRGTVNCNEKGDVATVFGIFLDITNMKNTQLQLQEKIVELEKVNQFMIGRELKMIEIKKNGE